MVRYAPPLERRKGTDDKIPHHQRRRIWVPTRPTQEASSSHKEKNDAIASSKTKEQHRKKVSNQHAVFESAPPAVATETTRLILRKVENKTSGATSQEVQSSQEQNAAVDIKQNKEKEMGKVTAANISSEVATEMIQLKLSNVAKNSLKGQLQANENKEKREDDEIDKSTQEVDATEKSSVVATEMINLILRKVENKILGAKHQDSTEEGKHEKEPGRSSNKVRRSSHPLIEETQIEKQTETEPSLQNAAQTHRKKEQYSVAKGTQEDEALKQALEESILESEAAGSALWDQLETLEQKTGLVVVNMTGDGRCGYRGLAFHQLKRELGEAIGIDDKDIDSCTPRIQNTIAEALDKEGQTEEAAKVRKGEWLDTDHLNAAAKSLQCRIVVHSLADQHTRSYGVGQPEWNLGHISKPPHWVALEKRRSHIILTRSRSKTCTALTEKRQIALQSLEVWKQQDLKSKLGAKLKQMLTELDLPPESTSKDRAQSVTNLLNEILEEVQNRNTPRAQWPSIIQKMESEIIASQK
jgi:hypothetical protein